MKLIEPYKAVRLFFMAVLIIGCQFNTHESKTSSDVFSNQEKSIIKIASYTAQGDLVSLKEALNEGLENGLTINQTKEILVHLYAYAGFPRSIRGLQTLLDVLEDRKANGSVDEWGPEASPINDSRTKYERGVAVLEELVERPLDGKPAYQQFSPEMDSFLKEHLFADIFERDVLSYKQRELVTISVIASLGTLEPMLKSHYRLSLNVGWQPEQLQAFTQIIKATAGKEKSNAAHSVLNEVRDSRN
jgi:alkylhydroperoxidase/carboxymuconolactone decarboxylase family protein YurZ